MIKESNSVLKRFRELIFKGAFFREPLYTNATYIWASQVVRSAMSFAFWFLAARLYPKEVVGFTGTVSSMMMLMGTLSFLGLGQGLIRFLPESSKPQDLINTSFRLVTLICILVATVFLLGINLWAPAMSGILTDGLFGVLFVCLSLGYILLEVLLSTFIALRAASNTLIIALVVGGLRIGLIFPMSFINRDAVFLFLVYGAPLFLTFLIGVIKLVPRSLPDYQLGWHGFSLNKIFPLLRYSFANYMNNLLWMAPSRILPLIVLNILGDLSAADFYISWLLVNAVGMVPASLSTSLFVEGSTESDKLPEKSRRALWSGLLVTGVCVAGLTILARPILMIFGEDYTGKAISLVRLLSFAVFIGVIPTIYTGIARAKKWIGSLIGISGLRAVVSMVTAIYLATAYGLSGIGVAWIGAQILVAGFVVILMHRRRKMSFLISKFGD